MSLAENSNNYLPAPFSLTSAVLRFGKTVIPRSVGTSQDEEKENDQP